MDSIPGVKGGNGMLYVAQIGPHRAVCLVKPGHEPWLAWGCPQQPVYHRDPGLGSNSQPSPRSSGAVPPHLEPFRDRHTGADPGPQPWRDGSTPRSASEEFGWATASW